MIERNYYFSSNRGRASVWHVWLKPVSKGANDIYFAGGGYKREHGRDRDGFVFHLSIHRDGRSHIKWHNKKIHEYRLKNQTNFPICSVYTNADELLVPISPMPPLRGNVNAINIDGLNNPDKHTWCELFLGHCETQQYSAFIKQYASSHSNDHVVDRVDIGQGREIVVIARFVENAKLINEVSADTQGMNFDHTHRLITWGVKRINDGHVSIHDRSAVGAEWLRKVYRYYTTKRRLMATVAVAALRK